MTSRSCQWRCLCIPRVCSIMRLIPEGSWQQMLPLPGILAPPARLRWRMLRYRRYSNRHFEELSRRFFVTSPFPSQVNEERLRIGFCSAAASWKKRASMTSRSSEWRCLCVSRIFSIMRLTPQDIPLATHARLRWRTFPY